MPRLSKAGRNRRSRAKTVNATMPRTVISPNVSKALKSTRMTLTTLDRPLRHRLFAGKNLAILAVGSRHDRVGYISHAGAGRDGYDEVAVAAQPAP